MKAELSRLAAIIVQEMPMSERAKLIPFVEKAQSLKDIPEPWRGQMRALKKDLADPYGGRIQEL
jgi:hypothetical protein